MWRAQVGRVPLLLLDSDVEDNAPAEREVTDRLYGGGTDHRLLQEMLLGIGGVRAVRAFCELTGPPEPEVFHTNEGHAGFLGLERIRELTEDRAELRRGADGGPRRHGVHHAHPGPGRASTASRATSSRSTSAATTPWPGVPVERILELGAEPRAATRRCSTWPSWGCGWPSAPTA